MFEKMLVGMDFSSCAQHALEVARRHFPTVQRLLIYVAEQEAGTPSAVDLLDPGNSPDAQIKRATSTLDSLLRVGETATAVIGRPAEAILAEARTWGADVIVLGTHGRRGLTRLVFGSVAEDVVRVSPVPVLTIRELVATLESGEPVP